jgi:hypothetical protein
LKDLEYKKGEKKLNQECYFYKESKNVLNQNKKLATLLKF